MRDAAIIILSIIIAIMLVKTGVIEELLVSIQGIRYIGSFIAGIFFASAFTAALSTAVFVEIADINSIFLMAILGGLGALFGDLIIFHFVKDRLSENVAFLIKKSKSERWVAIFKMKFFRWLIPFLGALIIASPLPDEIGVAMMGLSKMKTWKFGILSFLLNSAGILIIGLIVKSI